MTKVWNSQENSVRIKIFILKRTACPTYYSRALVKEKHISKSREFLQRKLPTLKGRYFPLWQKFTVGFTELGNHQRRTRATLTNKSIICGKKRPAFGKAHCNHWNPNEQKQAATEKPPTRAVCSKDVATKVHHPTQRNARYEPDRHTVSEYPQS